jgi:glucosamine--fructose-6-phosphate aminotransferase (isomerizing)
MCGIFGYLGRAPAGPVLVSGLRTLAYRGYDSAGVAVPHEGGFALRRQEGPVERLEALLVTDPLPAAEAGIAHTRWATHGRPSDENAHPIPGCDGRVVVVHNGILTNHAELRAALGARGHVFTSETDTEVVAHLVEEGGEDLFAAVLAAARAAEGSYALAVMRADRPDELVAVRRTSPLLIGLGAGEAFLASDARAFAGRATRVLPLEDGEAARITRDGVTIVRLADGRPVRRRPQPLRLDPVDLDRGPYPHHFAKEMAEQPWAWGRLLARGLEPEARRLVDLDTPLMVFVGCGSAFHAARAAALLADRAGVAARAVLASEEVPVKALPRHALVVAISQSGETADTLEAVRSLRRTLSAPVLAVTNVPTSTLAREADAVVDLACGPEISVASTKAFTAQVLALALMLGRRTGRALVTPDLGAQAEDVLQRIPALRAWVPEVAAGPGVLFLGRGLDLVLAEEATLKMRELAYRWSFAIGAGELKHGPLALVEPGVPVVAFLTQAEEAERMRLALAEVAARGGRLFLVTSLPEAAERVFPLPASGGVGGLLLGTLAAQALAYQTAVALGCEVDRPRNLAKSVTVV